MSEVIEVKVSDLQPPALDWAVAHATKAWEWAHEWFPTMTLDPSFIGVMDSAPNGHAVLVPRNPMRQGYEEFFPSTDWAQGGRLIDMHVTALNQTGTHTWWAHSEDRLGEGDTPLIAACRAIVAAKLGDTVQVPAELVA